MKWKSIKGYDDRYQVSDRGLVRESEWTPTGWRKREVFVTKVLKPSVDSEGKMFVGLKDKNGIYSLHNVGKLVRETFPEKYNDLEGH